MLFSPFVKLAMALILTAEWFYIVPVILSQGNGGGGVRPYLRGGEKPACCGLQGIAEVRTQRIQRIT